jgi:hypothetical protein
MVVTIEGPVVAGIAIRHVFPPAMSIRTAAAPGWRDEVPTRPPVEVVHEFGDPVTPGLRTISAGEPHVGTYGLDARGLLIVRRALTRADDHPQVLHTQRPGLAYRLVYAPTDDPARLQWGWQRNIMTIALAERGFGLVAHAAGFLLPDGGAVLAPGASGAGKSTLAREVAAAGAVVLSDDRVVVEHAAGGPVAWGTPWYSSGRYASPRAGPLCALVFPARGSAASLRVLTPREAARRLLRTVALPFWNDAAMATTLGAVDVLVGSVPAMEFAYTPGRRAGEELVARIARPAARRRPA